MFSIGIIGTDNIVVRYNWYVLEFGSINIFRRRFVNYVSIFIIVNVIVFVLAHFVISGRYVNVNDVCDAVIVIFRRFVGKINWFVIRF